MTKFLKTFKGDWINMCHVESISPTAHGEIKAKMTTGYYYLISTAKDFDEASLQLDLLIDQITEDDT